MTKEEYARDSECERDRAPAKNCLDGPIQFQAAAKPVKRLPAGNGDKKEQQQAGNYVFSTHQ